VIASVTRWLSKTDSDRLYGLTGDVNRPKVGEVTAIDHRGLSGNTQVTAGIVSEAVTL
jgi:hypothetical protein